MPRLNNLARTVHPEALVEAISIHDAQTQSTFSSILGYKDLSKGKWRQACLLIRLGGFGMTSLIAVSSFAFVSSWAHSLNALPRRSPDMSRSLVDPVAMS